MAKKLILDACCGGRQIWFIKKEPHTIYMDIRLEPKGTIALQPNWCVEPDMIADYRELPFKDKAFKLIVWDIPHILSKKNKSIIQKKYGQLDDTYKKDLSTAFNELWRVLEDYGILEFKYADVSIPVKKMLKLFPIEPLFGTPTKKGVNNTFWFCFMKIPEGDA